MKNNFLFAILCACIVLCVACSEQSVPKPRGYYRIAIPDTAFYQLSTVTAHDSRLTTQFPYTFAVSQNARVYPLTEEKEPYWLDIIYPAFDVRIHCTYYPVGNDLRELSDDAQRFVYNHASQASAIPEQGFINDEQRVYGVFYELQGNTASPYQFYLTDSTNHFFRAAVYLNCEPNQDSLAPIINYMRDDVRHLIETFQWKK